MAGRGPAPKDPARRARRNADPTPMTVLEFQPARQPNLPAGTDWHPQTREWWAMWQRSPQAALMSESDWHFLLDTALMHTALWEGGHWTLAAELRLRVAKFGATLEDRQRLRLQFAEADAADAARPERPPASTKERYGELRVLHTPTSS